MIEYVMKGISADELSFKVTPMKGQPNGKIALHPQFSRKVQPVKENPAIHLVALECKIEGTEAEPLPYRILVRFVGVFEVKNMNTDEDRRIFFINATETMFPYLRAALASLTADALVMPLQLPAVSGATLFPEDRGVGGYTLSVDPKVVN